MDRSEPRFVDAGLDDLPPAVDDDEIVSIGEPIWDVVKLDVTGPRSLAVTFENGTHGSVRFESSALTGYCAKLADPDYFAKANIAYGRVSWPNEEPDLAPDVMYDEIKTHGEWVLK